MGEAGERAGCATLQTEKCQSVLLRVSIRPL
jgi:hypothetical protein